MATKKKAFQVAKTLKAWRKVGGYDDLAKAAFHREAKRTLKAVAEAMGLPKGAYDLRSNLAGPACSGEVTLHIDRLYIQVQAPCLGIGLEVLYRICKSRKDYCGEYNNYAHVEELDDPQAFAAKMAKFLRWRFPQAAQAMLQVAS